MDIKNKLYTVKCHKRDMYILRLGMMTIFTSRSFEECNTQQVYLAAGGTKLLRYIAEEYGSMGYTRHYSTWLSCYNAITVVAENKEPSTDILAQANYLNRTLPMITDSHIELVKKYYLNHLDQKELKKGLK